MPTQALALGLLLGAAAAAAQEGRDDPGPARDPAALRYVLGMSLAYQPEYVGAERHTLKPRETWAVRWGRWRVGNSGAVGLTGDADPAAGAGASAALQERGRWKFGVGLRIDRGRSSADSASLTGLPDVKGTLRGRIAAAYAPDAHWQAGLTVSQDVLGQGGGAQASLDLGYTDQWDGDLRGHAGLGLSLANGPYLRSRFGIDAQGSARSGLPVWRPRPGLLDLHAGAGLALPLGPSWVLFGGLHLSSLQGDAARSPVTRRATALSLSTGLAFRARP